MAQSVESQGQPPAEFTNLPTSVSSIPGVIQPVETVRKYMALTLMHSAAAREYTLRIFLTV